MTTNFEVIDADGHITEEDSQLKKYMEAKYRDRAATLTPRDSWDRSLSGKLGTRAKDAKSWLDAMKNRYRLREWRPMVVDMAEPGAKPRTERYDIYEFVPIDLVRHEADDHVSSR